MSKDTIEIKDEPPCHGYAAGPDFLFTWDGADLLLNGMAVRAADQTLISDSGSTLATIPVELDGDAARVATFFGLDGKPAIRVRFGEGIEPEVLGLDGDDHGRG